MKFITSNRDYQRVYENCKILKGNLFIFLIQKEISVDSLSVGIVVSKKVGNAVVRNKVKRRIKAFIRENSEIKPVSKNIIIKAKLEAGSANWQEIKEDLTEIFLKIQHS